MSPSVASGVDTLLSIGGMGVGAALTRSGRYATVSTSQAACSTQTAQVSSSAVSQGPQLNTFNLYASELSDVGKTNIRILRGWAKSKGWERYQILTRGSRKVGFTEYTRKIGNKP